MPEQPLSSTTADMTIQPVEPTQKLKIAVVGGAGHIGSAVCTQALKDGHEVLALDRGTKGRLSPQERYEYRQLDANDFLKYKEAIKDCNALVHLSAVYNLHDDEGNITTDVLQSVSLH